MDGCMEGCEVGGEDDARLDRWPTFSASRDPIADLDFREGMDVGEVEVGVGGEGEEERVAGGREEVDMLGMAGCETGGTGGTGGGTEGGTGEADRVGERLGITGDVGVEGAEEGGLGEVGGEKGGAEEGGVVGVGERAITGVDEPQGDPGVDKDRGEGGREMLSPF